MLFDHTIFGNREFCISTSSVVLIGFGQSDEYLPRVKLSIILQGVLSVLKTERLACEDPNQS